MTSLNSFAKIERKKENRFVTEFPTHFQTIELWNL